MNHVIIVNSTTPSTCFTFPAIPTLHGNPVSVFAFFSSRRDPNIAWRPCCYCARFVHFLTQSQYCIATLPVPSRCSLLDTIPTLHGEFGDPASVFALFTSRRDPNIVWCPASAFALFISRRDPNIAW